MTPGKIDAQGMATLAGERRERTPLPPKPPVPRADYDQLRAASARSSEIILQLSKRLALYETEDTVQRAAEAHRRYLRSLGVYV
jgi:hypothetical protein